MDVILSTHNRSTALQISMILRSLPVTIRTLDEAGIAGKTDECGISLEERAVRKAAFAWEHSRQWSIADATGLFIHALHGAPGTRAVRWAGTASAEDLAYFALIRLEGAQDRSATMRTVAALISPNGVLTTFLGEVRGTILTKPRKACRPALPYGTIFVPDGQSASWAEMTLEEEARTSPRGLAFRRMRDLLAEI